MDNQFDEMIECIKMLKIISDELIKFITETKNICNNYDAKISAMIAEKEKEQEPREEKQEIID